MNMLDTEKFDAPTLALSAHPDHLADLVWGSECRYLSRLGDPEGSVVADFEINPASVNLDDDSFPERLNEYASWLRTVLSERLGTPNVLLNLSIRH